MKQWESGWRLMAAAVVLLAGCSVFGEVASNSLRLVFFTDVHARTEWETPRALELAARAMNAAAPDLIVGGGDCITEGFESSAAAMEPRWEVYLAFQRALSAPVAVAIGNHDLVAALPADGSKPLADPRSIFRERMGLSATYRSLDSNGYHIVFLDAVEVTPGPLKYTGRIGPEQLAWLRQDLAGVPTSTPVIVVSHIPLATDEYRDREPPPNRVIVNWDEILQCFDQHSLILVLQGHLHVAEQLEKGATTFITGGAICGQWWRGPWKGTPEGFYVIDLKGTAVEAHYQAYGWTARRPADQ